MRRSFCQRFLLLFKINEQTHLPQIIWDNLPSVLQKRYKVADDK